MALFEAYKQKVGRREKSSENNDGGDGVPIVDDIVKPVQDSWLMSS